MVDKNHNGIDDRIDPAYKPGTPKFTGGATPTAQWLAPPTEKPYGSAAFLNELGNFDRDANRNWRNFLDSTRNWFEGGKDIPQGEGWGDHTVPKNGVYGPGPRDSGLDAGLNARSAAGGVGVGTNNPPGAAGEEDPFTFLDALAQGAGIFDQFGGSAVDYSPAVNEANSTRDRNSAYLGAVYNQLRGELDSDRPKIQENFGGAIDRNQQITKTAQDATRSAYDAAQARSDQETNALGMQTAAASIGQERPGLQAQAADAIGDQATYGQNAQQMYNGKETSALTHNTNIRGASNFAETRSQADLNSSLANRLAELSVQQSQANSDFQNKRSSGIQSLGQYLYEDAKGQSQQDFENMLAVAQQKAEAQAAVAGKPLTLEDIFAQVEALKEKGVSIDDQSKIAGIGAQVAKFNK